MNIVIVEQAKVCPRTLNILKLLSNLDILVFSHEAEYDEDGKVWVLILGKESSES